jgi:hypothetical protein
MVIADAATRTIATSQPAPSGDRPRALGLVNTGDPQRRMDRPAWPASGIVPRLPAVIPSMAFAAR